MNPIIKSKAAHFRKVAMPNKTAPTVTIARTMTVASPAGPASTSAFCAALKTGQNESLSKQETYHQDHTKGFDSISDKTKYPTCFALSQLQGSQHP